MRRLATTVLGLWWAAALGLLLLRWWDAGGMVPILQSGLPLVGLSLVPLLLLALLARAWLLVVATCLLAVPMALLAAPWWLEGSAATASADDTVVLSLNTRYGEADLAELEDAVERLDVDALVLLEVTPDFATALDAGDIPRALPHRSGGARPDAGGTLVLTADPHDSVSVPEPTLFDQVAVRVQAEGTSWTLLAAHPPPPVLSREWRAELDLLGSWVEAQPDDTPLVLAGDFNASTAQPAYRAAFGQLTDAHQTSGAGWVRTWPRGSWLPPFTHLDHVLVREAAVVGAGEITVGRTDHQAVWARLSLDDD